MSHSTHREMHVHVLRARTLYQHAPLLGCVCVGIFGTQGVGVLMLVPEPEVHAEEHSSEAYLGAIVGRHVRSMKK